MDNGIEKRETRKNEYIVSFAKAMTNTKTSDWGNGATLEPGNYVLKAYNFSSNATVWNEFRLNGVKFTSEEGTIEFTVTTKATFSSYWFIDGSYGCVTYVLYKKA